MAEIAAIPRHDFAARVGIVEELLAGTAERCGALDTYLTEADVSGNIENFIGAVPVPLGLCGPIDIAGQYARGAFIVPMATLEGTLLASYTRGGRVMNESGGCETLVHDDAFLRGVLFATTSLAAAAALREWCVAHEGALRAAAEATSSHFKVLEVLYEHVGAGLLVSLRAETGDAMGSNMASKAAGALHDYAIANTDLGQGAVVPMPEDKKVLPLRRKGKKVIARTVLRREVVQRLTRASLEQLAVLIADYKNVLALHGATSLNIHAANGMAAMFQAFGQDMAYIGECAQAIVEARFLGPDSLEVAITLPSLIIATVGGGTGLPAHRATLAMVGCQGDGKARKLAEIMAAVILAGEIGCAAAQCAGEFIRAHETLGKNRP